MYAICRGMTHLEYNTLYDLMRDRYEETLAKIRDAYRESVRGLEALRVTLENDRPDVLGLIRKQHGDLIESVREAALKLEGIFTLQDVVEVLRTEKPALMLQTTRKSVSTALRRLYASHELVLVEEGRGTKPAFYSANATNKGNFLEKEAQMSTVSGRPA